MGSLHLALKLLAIAARRAARRATHYVVRAELSRAMPTLLLLKQRRRTSTHLGAPPVGLKHLPRPRRGTLVPHQALRRQRRAARLCHRRSCYTPEPLRITRSGPVAGALHDTCVAERAHLEVATQRPQLRQAGLGHVGAHARRQAHRSQQAVAVPLCSSSCAQRADSRRRLCLLHADPSLTARGRSSARCSPPAAVALSGCCCCCWRLREEVASWKPHSDCGPAS